MFEMNDELDCQVHKSHLASMVLLRLLKRKYNSYFSPELILFDQMYGNPFSMRRHVPLMPRTGRTLDEFCIDREQLYAFEDLVIDLTSDTDGEETVLASPATVEHDENESSDWLFWNS